MQENRHTYYTYIKPAGYLAFLWLLMFINGSLYAQRTPKEYRLRTVVIDAGHGGKDPGAQCKEGREKDIALGVALKLRKQIEKNLPDVKVILTRDGDYFVELFRRAQIANQNKADVFISVHVNSNKKSEPSGTETYVMGLHKTQGNLDVAMRENGVITKEDNYQNQYDGFDPHSPEGFIIFSLYQNAYLDQSLNLASKIQHQYAKTLGRTNKGVKQAGFLVLWKTAMPSVLTEIGFISNSEESKYLLDETNQAKIANAIFRAFREYKFEMEGNTAALQEKNEDPTPVQDSGQLTQPDSTAPLARVNSDTTAYGTPIVNDTIYFMVQISSSLKPIQLKKENFKGLTGVHERVFEGIYKYTCGESVNFNEAVKTQHEIRPVYPDAFVIAVKNGKKIPVNEAIKQTKN